MNIAEKSLSYVKAITAQSISNAGSGHMGTSLGASSILLALFKNHYHFDVSDSDYVNRDRFVLSAGHACPLYYTLLSMFGFDVTIQDLKDLRKKNSVTPGHPEYGKTDGVEVSTGPLGQGIANAVGMAIAENFLEERFNSVGFPIINNSIYCLAGDGDMMEGVAMEACSLAGTLNLHNLILMYDCNQVTIDGNLNLSNKEDVAAKFTAMGWKVIKVKNGNNFNSCSRAIAKAKKYDNPVLIIFNTTIGIGTDKEGTSAIHSLPLSKEELKVFNEKLGVLENFYVPSDVRDWCMASTRYGKLLHEKWSQDIAVYSNTNPDLYKQFIQFFDRKKFDLEKLAKNAYKWEGLSTREINKIVLNEVADKLQQVIGGTADVAPSTKAFIENASNFIAGNKRGRNIHYGIREHAMAAITNGIALYEEFLPFCSTFLTFANYLYPSIRMACLMKLNVIYMFTHDSIIVGQDGPTHQPVEQISQLRSFIGLNVFRPCDANELLAGYQLAINDKQPIAFILSKQNLPVIEKTSMKEAYLGGYVVLPAKRAADIVLYSSGSEVSLAMQVAKELAKKFDVSVVSFPCLEQFEKQSAAYKAKTLQSEAKLKVVIEAANDNIWFKYISQNDIFIGAFDYSYSCDGKQVYEEFGFEAKDIIKKILKKMK